jgi:hypothetical protein
VTEVGLLEYGCYGGRTSVEIDADRPERRSAFLERPLPASVGRLLARVRFFGRQVFIVGHDELECAEL